MSRENWVIIEQLGDRVETVSLELLGEALRLGKTMNAVPCAVVLGPKGFLTPDLRHELIRHGARKIYIAEDGALQHYQSEIVTEIVCQAIRLKRPLAVLIGATPNGNDFSPKVALRIGSGLVTNCTDIKISRDDRLVFIKQIYNGKVQATCIGAGEVQIATVKPDIIGLETTDSPPKNVKVEPLGIQSKSLNHQVDTVRFIQGDPATIDITEADIIVSGGKGIGGKAKWEIVSNLAKAMKASVAGSRMAMDEGCIDRERLVGQTGKTVNPKLYMAIGISGAIQHTMGLKNVDKIIAVNQDKAAPIMKRANLGIVADAHELLPMLIKRLNALIEKQN